MPKQSDRGLADYSDVSLCAELRILTYGQAVIDHAREQVREVRHVVSECLAGIRDEVEAA